MVLLNASNRRISKRPLCFNLVPPQSRRTRFAERGRLRPRPSFSRWIVGFRLPLVGKVTGSSQHTSWLIAKRVKRVRFSQERLTPRQLGLFAGMRVGAKRDDREFCKWPGAVFGRP